MKIFKYFFEAIIIYFLFFLSRIIGLEQSRKFFSRFFITLGPIIRSNKIIIKNLKIAKIKSISENKFCKEVWRSYGFFFAEFFYLNFFRKKSEHIEYKGLDILRDINKNNKKVIFVSGHFANFELMSMEIDKLGINLATIYRPLNNIFLNPLMEYLRKKYVCKNQIKKGVGGLKKIFKYLESNFSIALMIDQRLSEGKKFKFFESDAYTTTLPYQLSKKFEIDIVFIELKRESKNKFLMTINDPISSMGKSENQVCEELNRILAAF